MTTRNKINGWINLNKPLGMSSAAAVGKVKWLLKPEKVGHAGTLDPLATGVLPIALGEGTKCVNLLMDAKKTYIFEITFGERRSTDDAEGAVVATSAKIPTREEVLAVLPRFTGLISQMPPAFSALKVDGKRAYDLARAGEEVILNSRDVTVYSIELTSFNAERTAILKTQVSKGTYIRSLGRDIAQACGSEGYISKLHRSAVGPFTDREAISLDFLEDSAHKAPPLMGVLPLSVALDDIPAISLTAQQEQILRHGQQFSLVHPDTPLAAAIVDGELVALVRVEADQVITQRMLNRT